MTALIEMKAEDLELVKSIYNYYVLNSTATFHTIPLSLEELKEAIPVGDPKYKSFMIIRDGEPCGYCYFSPYKKRQAYDRTAEMTIYLKPGCTGAGMGRYALEHLEKIAYEQGFRVLLGIISGDNTYSVRLMENCGYEKCAHFKKVGEKFNKLLDVVGYQKILEG